MRDTVVAMQSSRIREVANAALKNPDVLAFWFGESDEVTPAGRARGRRRARSSAARPSMATTWAWSSCGTGWRSYTSGFHPARYTERIAVTSSGVNALMLATQLLAGAGDEVVAVVPVWPNLTQQPTMMGARVQARGASHPMPRACGIWTFRR